MTHSITRRQFLKASGLAAVGTCAAGLLSSCGGSSSAGSSAASGTASAGGSSYTILYDSQPSTLNYLTTSSDLEMQVGANCVDTLVEYDNKGVMKEGLATSWDWDVDTLTWTFHLRDENWVDCNGEVVAPVTAQDFVDALKYVLTPDYASSNVDLVTSYIAGADDYYNYYVYLANANGGIVDDDGTTYTVDASGVVTVAGPDGTTTYAPVDFEDVGVHAVDEHTLTYTLTYDFPGFLSLLCFLPYEPAYGPLLEEVGDQFATSAETTYSCGAYYLAEYESLETWIMKKNPENYDADNVFIETVSRIYNAEANVNGPEMIKRGEIDEATIGSDILDSWLADDTTKDMVSMDRPNTNYTYFYMFNFCPLPHNFSNATVDGLDAEYEPENWAKAINSTNFRKAFLYGINNAVTLAVQAPEGYENYKLNTVTPPSFCANSEGVDYLQCGDLANITEFFDEAKAKEYRDAAVVFQLLDSGLHGLGRGVAGTNNKQSTVHLIADDRRVCHHGDGRRVKDDIIKSGAQLLDHLLHPGRAQQLRGVRRGRAGGQERDLELLQPQQSLFQLALVGDNIGNALHVVTGFQVFVQHGLAQVAVHQGYIFAVFGQGQGQVD